MKPKLKPCSDCGTNAVIYKCYGREKCCKQCSMQRDKPAPIRKVSKKRAKQLREYSKITIPEGQKCQYPGCKKLATEKHHTQGRENQRLLDKDKIKFLCSDHHRLITDNTPLAFTLKLSVSKHKRA